jgi:hypothetical protein
MTPIPAPCGVGIRCDDLAFGCARACRLSIGRMAAIRAADAIAAIVIAVRTII